MNVSSPSLRAFQAMHGALTALPAPAELAGLLRAEYEGHQRAFIARDGGDGAGTAGAVCLARLAPAESGARTLGCAGFFAAADDSPASAAATAAVLGEAAAWLRANGAERIVGPMEGDTWHRYRFNLGPHHRPPFMLEPVQPTFYPGLWEAAGWRVAEGYSSSWIEDARAVVAASEHDRERAAAHGYRLRPFDAARFDDELRLMHRLSLAGFTDNMLYSSIGWEEFRGMYVAAKAMVQPGLVQFAETRDGETVGFVFSYPDAALRALCVKTLVIAPEHRRCGLAGALMQAVLGAAIDRGIPHAVHCLMHDSNASTKLAFGQSVLMRRYALYSPPEAGA